MKNKIYQTVIAILVVLMVVAGLYLNANQISKRDRETQRLKQTIQEQTEIIENQNKEIDDLNKRIGDLQNQIDEIKK